MSILASASKELHRSSNSGSLGSANLTAENIGSFLNGLQNTLKSIEQELRAKA